jgi:hypothetical protein
MGANLHFFFNYHLTLTKFKYKIMIVNKIFFIKYTSTGKKAVILATYHSFF